MKVKMGKLLTKGHALFLAYDHGMEHGPTDFNGKNVDPSYVLGIAEKGKFNGVVFQKGIAEKYYDPKKNKVPLILKLNGKTSLVKGDPISRQLCTVKEAVKLGASAVGYTIYLGSMHESVMFQEFEKIESEAHRRGIPVIVWMYPRGKSIKNDTSKDILAYATRAALELGADIVKVKYPSDSKALGWMVKSAGRTKVVIAGGAKKTDKALLRQVELIVKSGAAGIAIGRNVWQHKNPLAIAGALRAIIFAGKSAEEAGRLLR